jgi:hypothetical protein
MGRFRPGVGVPPKVRNHLGPQPAVAIDQHTGAVFMVGATCVGLSALVRRGTCQC